MGEVGNIVAGDFNHDGILDVAVVSNANASINVMFAQGNGDGTFTYVGLYNLTSGYNYAAAEAADLNNDGNLDIVVPAQDDVYILLGNGKFGFTQSALLGNGEGGAEGVTIADFNKDGIPDLAVSYGAPYDTYVSVLLGIGNGTFQAPVNYPTNVGGAYGIASGDVNGDGILDIIASSGAGGSSICVFLGVGNGTFQPVIISPSVYNANQLAVGDFNGDDKVDAIVSSSYEGGGDFVGVLFSNGDGTFAPPVQYAVTPGPTGVFVTDLNGDGHPDWVSIGSGSEYINVALGSGTGGFLAAEDDYTTPGIYNDGATTAIVAADFNQDGNLDYATVGAERNYPGLNISIGDGSGNFVTPVHYTAGNNPSALVSADFNHDGYPDIAVLDQSDDMVSVLLNNGNGTFASAVSYQVGNGSA
jgi:hypothetical protein